MYTSFRENKPDPKDVPKIESTINFIESFDGEDVFTPPDKRSTYRVVKISHVESEGTKQQQKQESINNYAALMTQLAMKKEMYDLPGMPSFFTIQMYNKEYFSYDPQGDPNIRNTHLVTPHCHLCLCPSQYCCDVVFGPHVLRHTETILYTSKNRQLMNLQEVTGIFRRVYSEVVNAKMIFNKTPFIMDVDKRLSYPVPKCVARGSLKKILIVFTTEIQKMK